MLRDVLGLGNPGSEYKYSKHNIGFLCLDHYAKKKKVKFKRKKLLKIAQMGKTFLVKPLTYMNRSGEALTFIADYYKVEEFLIVVDDIYLKFADIRIKQKGGDGGHNGLKSIIQSYGDQNFHRIRIGIENRREGNLSDYVLSDFNSVELDILSKTFDFTDELLNIYCNENISEMMNYFSRNKKTYSTKISKLFSFSIIMNRPSACIFHVSCYNTI